MGEETTRGIPGKSRPDAYSTLGDWNTLREANVSATALLPFSRTRGRETKSEVVWVPRRDHKYKDPTLGDQGGAS